MYVCIHVRVYVCAFQETYPHSPPVWFAETEDTNVTNAIERLSNTVGKDNHVSIIIIIIIIVVIIIIIIIVVVVVIIVIVVVFW